MGALRVFMWIVGCVMVLAGLAMLYFETGLSEAVSYTVAGLGLLVLLGLMIMGASTRAQPAPRVVVDRPVPIVRSNLRSDRHARDDGFVEVPDLPEPWEPVGGTDTADKRLPKGRLVEYTGVARTARTGPDGTIVEGTVRTRRVVRNTKAGRRTYTRKTKTVTRRRPTATRRAGKAPRTRTHGRRKTVAGRAR